MKNQATTLPNTSSERAWVECIPMLKDTRLSLSSSREPAAKESRSAPKATQPVEHLPTP